MSMFLIKKKLKTDELLLTRKYWIDSPSSSLVIDEKNPVVEFVAGFRFSTMKMLL